jgi:RimJ/RimL family protein N-acetyltransferase
VSADRTAPRRTERLLLRPAAATDLESVFAIHGDPRTSLFNPAGPHRDLDESRAMLDSWLAHWDRHGFGHWAVATQDEPGRVIGVGGINVRSYNGDMRHNLGYRLAFDAWGHGYATELGREALRFAFDELGLPAVHALVRPANLASRAVLRKLGLHENGVLDDVPGEAPSLLFLIERP